MANKTTTLDTTSKEVDELQKIVRRWIPIDHQKFDYDWHTKTVEGLSAQLNQWKDKRIVEELETFRKSMRGEDPDQYRPRDMVSMGLVEALIQNHDTEKKQQVLRALGDAQNWNDAIDIIRTVIQMESLGGRSDDVR